MRFLWSTTSSKPTTGNNLAPDLVQMLCNINVIYIYFLNGAVASVCCSKSRFEEFMQLFNHYHKLSEVLREKSGKGRVPSHKAPRSLLSLGFISTVLTVLFR